MAINLIGTPPRAPYYAASDGPQGDFAWTFIQDEAWLAAPTPASFSLQIPAGSGLSGSASLGGATISAGAETTAATFMPSNDALVTAQAIADALRANTITAGKWRFFISGSSSSAVLTATAVMAGVSYPLASASFQPFVSFSNTPATAGAELGHHYYWQLVHVDFAGAETPCGDPIRYPIPLDYRTIQAAPAFADVQRAAARMLSLPYPALIPMTLGFEPTAMGKYYLRYGTVRFVGCSLLGQDLKISDPHYMALQAFDVFDEYGPVIYSGSAATRMRSIMSRSGMCLADNQSAWVYAVFERPSGSQRIAARYEVFDASGALLSTSIREVSWPLTAHDLGVLRVPCGPFNGSVFAAAGMKVRVSVGTVPIAGSSFFSQTHAAYEYKVCSSHCVEAEIHFVSSDGAWESMAFRKAAEKTDAVSQTSHRLPKKHRVWQTSLGRRAQWADYADKSGEAQSNTSAKRRFKLRPAFVLGKEASLRLFSELLRSEDRRMVIARLPALVGAGLAGSARLTSARIISLTGQMDMAQNPSEFEIEVEISDELATVTAR